VCEFCVKHGEGKKWYLNAKNYSSDLLSDVGRFKYVKDSFYLLDGVYNNHFRVLNYLPLAVPVLGSFVRKVIKQMFMYDHWGQVVPIEDVTKILDFTNSITRAPCICRKITTGKEKRMCFFVSLDPGKIGIAEIIDKSFFGAPDMTKFEKVDKGWAADFMRESETSGAFHTIWTLKTPFIGAICNCDASTGCIPMKMYKKRAPIMFRAEYIAKIIEESCIGCQNCIKICPFAAIGFNKKNRKAYILPKRCYGCGICRTMCKKNSIFLQDRDAMSVAKKYGKNL